VGWTISNHHNFFLNQFNRISHTSSTEDIIDSIYNVIVLKIPSNKPKYYLEKKSKLKTILRDKTKQTIIIGSIASSEVK
jgi:hypothetical protein